MLSTTCCPSAAAEPVGGLPKRALDIVISLAAILIFLPIIALVWIALSLSGPALFKQARVGFGGRQFNCYKFRSMIVGAEPVLERHLREDAEARAEWNAHRKLRNDPRITPLGRFLRKTSLDELPQLFNVLAGDMSIVGPRPIVSAEVPRYGASFDAYVAARPGLTGLWQVSGRSDCPYPERVALDAHYVRQWAFAFDLMLLAKTVPIVMACRGSC